MLFTFSFLGLGGDADESEVTRDFLPNPESAPAARKFVMSAATGDFQDEARSRISSLVSELATNAILHARTPFRVKVTEGRSRIRVSVSDESPAALVKRSYGASQPTGRGLLIVDSLADRWGVALGDDGKTVWFEIDEAAS